MTTPPSQATRFAPLAKLRLILDSIRFEHTIFALPFAYLSMVLAAEAYASSKAATDRSSSRSSQ